MDQDQRQTEKILHLTLEIICLLTGETFTAVTSGDLVAIMAPQHHFVIPKRTNKEIILEVTKKIIELLTGEVPIRCQDVAIYLSMEEQEYLEEHKERYMAAMTQDEGCRAGSRNSGDFITEVQKDPECSAPQDPHKFTAVTVQESHLTAPYYQSPAEERPTEVIDLDSPDEDPATPDAPPLPGSPDSPHPRDPPHPRDSSLSKLQTMTRSIVGGEDLIPCLQCPKSFTSKYALLSHLRVHSGERPFLCCECGKRFTQRRNLIRHEQIHSGGRGFPCPLCGRTFTRKLYLDKHLQNHGVLSNDVTPTVDTPPTPDNSDVALASPGAIPVTPIAIYPGVPETLADLSNLVQSFPVVPVPIAPDVPPVLRTEEEEEEGAADPPNHENASPKKADTSGEDAPEEKCSCYECGECFTSKSDLHTHWKSHMEERPFPCFECGKSFARKDNLIQHQIIHSGEKPFACNLCNKTFARKSNLADHRRTHIEQQAKQPTGESPALPSNHVAEVEITLDYPDEDLGVPNAEPPSDHLSNPEQTFAEKSHPQAAQERDGDFKCSQCAKNFASRYALLSHLRVHTEERPFACFQCKKRFTRRDNLKQHLILHSRDKPSPRPPTADRPPSGQSDQASHNAHNHSGKDSEEQDASSTDHDAEVEILLDFPEAKPATLNPDPAHDADRGAELSAPEEPAQETAQDGATIARVKGVFACSECKKFFTSKYALLSHRRIHSGERPYACVECGRRFTRKDNLVRHRVIHSKGYKPGKHFSKKVRDLPNHTEEQDGKKNPEGEQELPPDVEAVIVMLDYPEEAPVVAKADPRPNTPEAPLDPSKFKLPPLDAPHGDIQSDGERGAPEVSCTVCGKGFASRYALHSHGRIHIQGSYPCSECGKRFTRKYNLKQHLILHAKKKLLQRATSRRSFTDKEDLDGYQTNQSDSHNEKKAEPVTSLLDGEEVVAITLDFPEMIPISPVYPGLHHADVSAEEPPPDMFNTGAQSVQDFSCSECEISFTSLNALHTHQRVHAPEEHPALYSDGHAKETAPEILPAYQIERTDLSGGAAREGKTEDGAYRRPEQPPMEQTKMLVKREEEEHSTEIRSAHGRCVKKIPQGTTLTNLQLIKRNQIPLGENSREKSTLCQISIWGNPSLDRSPDPLNFKEPSPKGSSTAKRNAGG